MQSFFRFFIKEISYCNSVDARSKDHPQALRIFPSRYIPSPPKMKDRTTKYRGDQLEKRVERLYKRLGKFNVKRNLVITDKFGNISQIDVVYGMFFRTYIECKNYSGPVPLEDVAKFKGK